MTQGKKIRGFWLLTMWVGAVAWGVGGGAFIRRGLYLPGAFSFITGAFMVVAATAYGALASFAE
jgi:hypothetical protein